MYLVVERGVMNNLFIYECIHSNATECNFVLVSVAVLCHPVMLLVMDMDGAMQLHGFMAKCNNIFYRRF